MSCPDGFVLDLFASFDPFWLACLFYLFVYMVRASVRFLDGLGFDL